MTEAVTQGLLASGDAALERTRRLPFAGRVLVTAGQSVRSETPVAETLLPGRVEVVPVAAQLGVAPHEVSGHLVVQEGDEVAEGQVLARSQGFLGFFRTQCVSPLSGRVESVSPITGQMILRTAPTRVDVRAYLDGTVTRVLPGEGAVIETRGALVQGIFGVGGERWGTIAVRVSNPKEALAPDAIDETCRGAIVVGGSRPSEGTLARARDLGVLGLVFGSLTDRELRAYLGYDLAGAITGQEPVPASLVLTEGFGDLAMGERVFRILHERDGERASLNGRTQIRAGVIRPEVIVPHAGKARESGTPEFRAVLEVGARVRCVREPWFGRVGEVVSLPEAPEELETESFARVVEVRLEDGTIARVPRTNVEAVWGST